MSMSLIWASGCCRFNLSLHVQRFLISRLCRSRLPSLERHIHRPQFRVSSDVGYERNQIPQNANLNDADDGTTLVACQLSIPALHGNYNAATAIDTSGFMRDDRESTARWISLAN